MARKTNGLSPHRIEEAERIARAVSLRRQGLSFALIASTLGYSSRGAAYRAIRHYVCALGKADAEALRELEAMRLDDAVLAIYPAVRNGDLGAIATMLKIMERRARFFGLDAPTKIAPTSPGGDEEYEPLSVEEAVARFTAMIGAEPPEIPVYANDAEMAAALGM